MIKIKAELDKVNNGFGYWCESREPRDFEECVNLMLSSDISTMGEKGYQYLEDHYQVEQAYHAIVDSIQD